MWKFSFMLQLEDKIAEFHSGGSLLLSSDLPLVDAAVAAKQNNPKSLSAAFLRRKDNQAKGCVHGICDIQKRTLERLPKVRPNLM